MSRILIALALILAALLTTPRADEKPGRPLWMMPPSARDGQSFRALFEHPDQWRETRSRVAGIGYADHRLNKQFSDEELRAWLPKLEEWGLKFCLEVGAVKPWGPTGPAAFHAERPMWDRFRRLGARIDALALDEPLVCVRHDLKKDDDYAVEETARFIALVRRYDPTIRIGDIEPYPSIPRDDLVAWIDALQARLKREGGRGLDFFRLDVDWAHFIVGPHGSWREVKAVESACRARKLPFSLVYWAADYPQVKRRGLADESVWYVSVLHQAQAYALVDGHPDEYVIESWIDAPAHAVPETEDWTFCRTVRDFARRFNP